MTNTANKASGYADDDKLPLDEAAALAAEIVACRLTTAKGAALEITSHLAESSGKGIRTLLLTRCAADGDGNAPASSAKAAAAIELLHMATLVHDDVIDDAKTRRGKPSVQSRFGKKRAVIAGDWLLCASLNLAASIDLSGESGSDNQMTVAAFAKAVEHVCLGELMQESQNGNLALSAPGYLRIISQKTAALFVLAAHAGAHVGGKDESETKQLLKFARYLGIVFQIVDDLKDYMLNEQQILKPAKNDLASGVITLPLIFGLIRVPELKPLVSEAVKTGGDFENVIREINRSGGSDDAKEIIRHYAKKAEKALSKLKNQAQKDALGELLLGATKVVL